MKRFIVIIFAAVLCLSSCAEKKTVKQSTAIFPGDLYGDVEYGVAFRKDDVTLAKKFDEALAAMISDGTAGKICENWFNNDYIDTDSSAEYDDVLESSYKNVTDNGTVKVGFMSEAYPMTFKDANGQVVGCDADLAREAVRRLGLSCTFVEVTMKSMESKLASGDVDCLFCAVVMDGNAKSRYLFSRGYFKTGYTLMISKDVSFTNLSQFEGQKVGINEGSAAETYLNDSGIAFGEIAQYSSNIYGYYRLCEGKIQAMFVDDTFAYWVKQGKLER